MDTTLQNRGNRFIDLTGRRFGSLTVVCLSHVNRRNKTYWSCVCDCGATKNIRGDALKAREPTVSCGCHSRYRDFVDLTGRVFGKLTVEKLVEKNGKHTTWECKCACGQVLVAYGYSLRNFDKRSCGCLRRWSTLARFKKERATYDRMLRRCRSPSASNYQFYGGRGIMVCDRWIGPTGFANFLKDIGPAPSREHSIDRIDNDGDYEPSNVRWATKKQQARNKRSSRLLTLHGRTMTLAEWSEETGLSAKVIGGRLQRGWSQERALTTA